MNSITKLCSIYGIGNYTPITKNAVRLMRDGLGDNETDEMCKSASRYSELLAAGKLSKADIIRMLQPLKNVVTARTNSYVDTHLVPEAIAEKGSKFQILIAIRNALKLPTNMPKVIIPDHHLPANFPSPANAHFEKSVKTLGQHGFDNDKAVSFLRNFPEMPGLKKVTDDLHFGEKLPTTSNVPLPQMNIEKLYRGTILPPRLKQQAILHGSPHADVTSQYAIGMHHPGHIPVLPDRTGFLSTYRTAPEQSYGGDYSLTGDVKLQQTKSQHHPIEWLKDPANNYSSYDTYETNVANNEMVGTKLVRAIPKSPIPDFVTADIPQTPQWNHILRNINRP